MIFLFSEQDSDDIDSDDIAYRKQRFEGYSLSIDTINPCNNTSSHWKHDDSNFV